MKFLPYIILAFKKLEPTTSNTIASAKNKYFIILFFDVKKRNNITYDIQH